MLLFRSALRRNRNAPNTWVIGVLGAGYKGFAK